MERGKVGDYDDGKSDVEGGRKAVENGREDGAATKHGSASVVERDARAL